MLLEVGQLELHLSMGVVGQWGLEEVVLQGLVGMYTELADCCMV